MRCRESLLGLQWQMALGIHSNILHLNLSTHWSGTVSLLTPAFHSLLHSRFEYETSFQSWGNCLIHESPFGSCTNRCTGSRAQEASPEPEFSELVAVLEISNNARSHHIPVFTGTRIPQCPRRFLLSAAVMYGFPFVIEVAATWWPRNARNTPRHKVYTVYPCIGNSRWCNSDASSQDIHDAKTPRTGRPCVPVRVFVRPPAIFIALQNGNNDFDAAFRPPIANDHSSQSGLQVYGQVSFIGITDVAPALSRCEGCKFDMCRYKSMWSERCRAWKGPRAMNGACQLDSWRRTLKGERMWCTGRGRLELKVCRTRRRRGQAGPQDLGSRRFSHPFHHWPVWQSEERGYPSTYTSSSTRPVALCAIVGLRTCWLQIATQSTGRPVLRCRQKDP